ncbi:MULTISPECIES: AfsR/SARP family transcriptional regulator [Saccharothrix]|uniref:AfsR/SARP family transcriptional regulator n=1 Tax=Saccharothrix TaxID=2071 RepID=UPI0009390307|nr:AfsR/SARP family transcriptional regulator [Saccharothrix sp. CB00851]OKI38903.1 hypothetical protein A6A25_01495 [Saccharothrix sp. CB00851]
MTADARFGVLGPLDVRWGDRPVPVPAGRARVLLATLLLRANRPVAVDDLVERLWDGDAPNPRRARATLHMVVTRLRQALGEANVVRTTANGYLAEVPPGALDLHRFRELAAAGEFTAASRLWRGEPLSDVPSPSLHAEDVAPLLEEHLVVRERRIESDLAAGAAGELVPELRSLTRRHPLRERFWGLLMLALSRAGQRDVALAAYEELRTRLADELGVEPGPNVQRLHRDLLGARPVPRQLPSPNGFFAGREEELRELTGLLDADAGAVVISAIGGAAGIGKTAFAVHWANLAAEAFTGGRLYANLRGFDPSAEPVPPGEVIRGFLDALDDAKSRALLERRLGPGRLAEEAAATDTLVELCAGLPLALAVVATRAAVNPHFTLADVADQLAVDRELLEHMDTGEEDARLCTVFSWSYRLLGPMAARVFRLLGHHPVPSSPVSAAAAVAGLPVPDAEAAIAQLTDAHLLFEHVPGRYSIHPLLRRYAVELVDIEGDDVDAAHRRALTWYAHTAANAVRWSTGEAAPVLPAHDCVRPDEFTSAEAASAWLDAEWESFVLLVRDETTR